MKYREFGNSGISVSEVGFGSWAIGGNEHGNSYGYTDDKVSAEAIERALELGCNFFDTADVYGLGHSEELLGKALKAHRHNVVIATKVGADFYGGAGHQDFTDKYIRYAIDKSLTRLKTDYIDVYQLHNPPLKLIEQPETYQIFDELKREGKIRTWGLSIFDPIEGLVALKSGRPDCLQLVYNIFSQKAAEELLQRAREANCAVIAREPLANGFLTGKYQGDSSFESGDIRHAWPRNFIQARTLAAERLRSTMPGSRLSLAQLALRFVLACEAVSVVIPGIKTADQAEENLTASDLPALNQAELAQINELLKSNFGLH